MQHLHLRCKHCQKEYTYCTYGNGPEYGTEEGCSTEYCAECQKAIDEALGKIPVKFTWRWKEIHEPLIFNLFKKIKEAEEKKEAELKENGTYFPRVVKFTQMWSEYDNIEEYGHNRRAYLVQWNDDAPDKKIVNIKATYDIAKKDFTGGAWEENDMGEYYSYYRPAKIPKNEDVKEVKPMAEPSGNFFFNDFIWEFAARKRNELMASPKPQHILRKYRKTMSGYTLAMRLLEDKNEHVRNGIDYHNIETILDYECLYEKYDDEEHEWLVDIEVV